MMHDYIHTLSIERLNMPILIMAGSHTGKTFSSARNLPSIYFYKNNETMELFL